MTTVQVPLPNQHTYHCFEFPYDGPAFLTHIAMPSHPKRLLQTTQAGTRRQTETDETDFPGIRSRASFWWTRLPPSVSCALSTFPVCMLPYSPLKFRWLAGCPKPSVLVDGKHLAFQMIIDPDVLVCRRNIEESDARAIDNYIVQGKICKCRPLRCFQLRRFLQEAAVQGVHGPEQEAAELELQNELDYAEVELAKLRLSKERACSSHAQRTTQRQNNQKLLSMHASLSASEPPPSEASTDVEYSEYKQPIVATPEQPSSAVASVAAPMPGSLPPTILVQRNHFRGSMSHDMKAILD